MAVVAPPSSLPPLPRPGGAVAGLGRVDGWGASRLPFGGSCPISLATPSQQLHWVAAVGAAADGRRLRPPLANPFFAFVLYISTSSSCLFGLLALFVFFRFSLFFFFWSFLSLFSGRCVSPDCSRLTHSHRRPSRFATCGFFIGGAWVFFQRSPLVVRGGGAGGYDAAAQARGRAPFCESGAVRRCVRTGCYSEQASNCDAHFDFLLCVATLLF